MQAQEDRVTGQERGASCALAVGMALAWLQVQETGLLTRFAMNPWLPLAAGVGLAVLVTVLQRHPCRRLGLVPLGWVLLLAVVLADFDRGDNAVSPWYVEVSLGAGTVLAALPLVINGAQLTKTTLYLALVLSIIVVDGFLGAVAIGFATPAVRPWLLLAVAVLGTVLTSVFLLRAVVEACLEVLFWPMYRIRSHGPGARLVPRKGPVLIVCNHTAYADPFWLGKVVPRSLRPLMLSVFYDLPVICWTMRHLIRAIRVPMTGFRRTAPELDEAAAGLKRGDCIVVFPEGRLRRKAEVVLGSFGQGAWRILKEVPQTQVVCVWIEGGWGSFSSYAGGKPMQGKRLDWRRPIDVALAAPVVLSPEILASQEATRAELRRAVLECRRFLGLEPVADEQIAAADSGQEEEVHEINP